MKIRIKKEKIVRNNFAHLHVHSEYSVLDGMCKIERGALSLNRVTLTGTTLVSRVKELGMNSIAITDHGSLGGYYRFNYECKENNVKPIIGVELYVTDDIGKKNRGERHLVLLAKNYEGLRILFRLTTDSYLIGFHYRPRVDLELIKKNIYEIGKGNLIALSACIDGILPTLLLNQDVSGAKRHINEMLDLFDGDYYGEIMPHQISDQITVNESLVDISKTTGLKLVATNDVHYVKKEHYKVHEALLCVQTGSNLSDEDRFSFDGNSYYLCSRDEMKKLFLENHPNISEEIVELAIDNTKKISDKIDIEIPKRGNIMPNCKVPEEYENKKQWVLDECRKGWYKFYLEKNVRENSKRWGVSKSKAKERYTDQLHYELDLIEKLGFFDYFLIVKELYDFVDENGIVRGPARGSAAGCLVSYLLGITKVDPLRYDLLFERFMNANKTTPPDIDMDFDDSRREEVFNWFRERFGEDCVAQIGTWGTMGGKMVLRDIGRVLGVPLDEVNKVSKFIIQRSGGDERSCNTLEDTFIEFDDVRKFNEKYPEVFEIGSVLEGTIRQKGIHASGLVASPFPLRDVMPLEVRSKKICTSITGKEVEKNGFLKFDILGLKTLRVINYALNEINRNYDVDLDLSSIDMDEKKCFEELSKGNNTGIFQFDSIGCARECRNMGFSKFEDLIAMTALYRPGTMRSGLTSRYIARKNGKKEIKYLHPTYDKITQDTYGTIIFQEQVVKIFNELAGLPYTEADNARVIVAKSQGSDLIEQYRKRVVDGCVNSGMDSKEAKKMFDNITFFASYAFNKAHATSYALISYHTIYLKVKYPTEFFCGLLSSGYDKGRVASFIRDARRIGIIVLMPDVNKSGWGYRTEKGEGINYDLRCGLRDIMNVGEKAGSDIESKQPYSDFFDFLDKVNRRVVNKRVICNLIKAGAFYCFCTNTKKMLEEYEKILNKHSAKKKDKSSDRAVILGDMKRWSEENGFDEKEEIQIKMEVLPIPPDKNPIEFYQEELNKVRYTFTDLCVLESMDDNEEENSGFSNDRLFVRGYILDKTYQRIGDFAVGKLTDDAKRKYSRFEWGARFLDFNIQDDTTNIRCRFHPDKYQKYKRFCDSMKPGLVVIIEGKFFSPAKLFFVKNILDLSSAECKEYDFTEEIFKKRMINGVGIRMYNIKGQKFYPVDDNKMFRKANKWDRIKFCGLIIDIMNMKKGGARVELEGIKETRDLLVWKDVWCNFREYFKLGNIVLFSAKKMDDKVMGMDDRDCVYFSKKCEL